MDLKQIWVSNNFHKKLSEKDYEQDAWGRRLMLFINFQSMIVNL